MTVPPYVLEKFKAQYLEGKLGWSSISLTVPYSEDWPNKVEQRAMFIMLGADDPNDNNRLYWDYELHNNRFTSLINASRGELDNALKLCLRQFVATDNPALLVQRLKFIGNILTRHPEVKNGVVDKDMADLFLGHVAPLTAEAVRDPESEKRKGYLDCCYLAFKVESAFHHNNLGSTATHLSDKFRDFAQGLMPLINTKGFSGYPPAAVSIAKHYLEGRRAHPDWM